MLKTIVKVSEVNNLSDARYCAGMGVEYIGFSMDNVPFEKYKEMRGWLAGIQIVGETTSNNTLHIQEMVGTYMPDALQISANTGNELPDLETLKELNLPIILKLDYAEANLPALFQSTANFVEYYLLENSDEFTPADDVIYQLETWAAQYPILLGFGITEDNANRLIDEAGFKGLALKGGQEIRPGFADMDELINILEVLDDDF
ncbi:MAG: N-(5'-phosphoribosyl)anthranilate isomerase [Flectobacillus sp.]|uniref:N-(5'-phosphoribosyl)anthranilate isomerase n=1 Tax=Flectobacillus sp. TaxID=50419 RepID=UPI003B9D67B6